MHRPLSVTKWLCLLVAVVFVPGASLKADPTGFTGVFDLSNWTFAPGGALSTYDPQGTSFSITGSMNADDQFSFTTFALSGLTDHYRISFDWSYSTTDISPVYDPAGYVRDTSTKLSDDFGPLTGQGASVKNLFVGSSSFNFYIRSDNSIATDGTSTLTISNFNFVLADPGDLGATVWTGANGSDWTNPDNWNTGAVPTINEDAVIDSGTSVLNNALAEVAGLTVANGSFTVQNTASGTSTSLALDAGGSLIVTGGASWLDKGSLTLNDGASILIHASDPDGDMPGDPGYAPVGGNLSAATETGTISIDFDSTVTVTGQGSSWGSPAFLSLATGAISILDHSAAMLGDIKMASFDDNVASLTVSGGAALTAEGIQTGAGEASILVDSGGHLTLTDSLSAGQEADSEATITVTGTGSQLNVQNNFVLYENATATVENGAELLTIGGLTFAGSSLTIKDAGTTWSDSGIRSLQGDATVRDGADATGVNLSIGGNATLTVTGTGTTWTDTDGAVVGDDGPGAIMIADHAVFTTQGPSDLGALSDGLVTVTGGAVWNVSGLRIANNTDDAVEGTLLIQDGGVVNDSNVFNMFKMATGADAVANLTITGTGSKLLSSSDFQIGDGGSATVLVSAGGQLNTGYGGIGDSSGGVGNVTVTGANSQWNVDSLDTFGTSSLTIADGGVVTAGGYISIGGTSGLTSTLNVGGNSATISTTGDDNIFIGDVGTGMVNLSAGGIVNAAHIIFLGNSSASKGIVNQTGGTVNVHDGYLEFSEGTPEYHLLGGTLSVNDTSGAGIIVGSPSSYLFELGGGTLQVNGGTESSLNIYANATLKTGTTSTLDVPAGGFQLMYWESVISGSGNIKITGPGTVVFDKANTYTGSTTIAGGTLRYGLTNSLSTSTNIIFDGGMLEFGANPFAMTPGTGGRQIQWLGDGGFSSYNGNRTISYQSGTQVTWGTSNFVPNAHKFLLGGSNVLGGTTTFANPINFNGAARTVQVSDGASTVDAILSGALTNGGLVKAGAGLLSLTGTNTYAGATEIQGGVLRVTATSLPSSSNVVLNGGVLELTTNTAFGAGTSAGQLSWTGSGGFSTSGADRTISYAGGAALTWGTTNFVPNGSTFILSSFDSANTTTFPNAIDFNGAARTVQVDDGTAAFDAVLGGVLSNGSLVKTGAGTLLLTGANTYTGPTTISGGTLALSGSGAISAANLSISGGVFASSGVFTRGFGAGAGQVSLSSTDGAGFAARSGALTLSFSGTPTWGVTPGFFSASSGPLILGSSIADNVVTWTSDFSLGAATRTITVNDNSGSSADSAVISGVISSGPGVGLIKNGAGTLQLSGANTYTGGTTVSAGTLRVVGSALPGGALSLAGGSLALVNDSNVAPGTLTTISSDQFTVTTITLDRVTAGAGVTVTMGTVALGTGFAGTSQGLTIARGTNVTSGTAGLVFGNATLSSDISLTTAASTQLTFGSITGTGDNYINVTGSGNTTILGAINTTTGQVSKSGTGTLTLSGNNTYTGIGSTRDVGTSITAGTVRATTSPNALGAGTLEMSGGTLELANDTGLNFGRNTTLRGSSAVAITSDVLTNGSAGVTHTMGTLSIAGQTFTLNKGANVGSGTAGLTFGATTLTGNATLAPASGTLLTLASVSGAARNLTVNGAGNVTTGAIATTTGTLTKGGTGTLTLTGANTYTGGTTISGGTLRFGATGSLASTGAVTVSGTTANGTATWDLNGLNQTISALNLGSTAAQANVVNTVSTGAGTLTLGGNVTYTNSTASANNPGTASITGKLALGGATRTFTLADSSNTTTELSIGADISGTGGIIKAGAGALALTGTNNTYSGSTSITAGALRISSLSNLPSTTNIQLNGGVLELAGAVALVPGTGAGQLQWTGSGGFSASGANRTVDFNGGSAVTWATTNFVGNGNSLLLGSTSASGTVTFPNDINLNGAVRTVTMNGSNATLSGVLSNGGLTVTGSGGLQLGSANTYTGVTTITNATLVATKLAAGNSPSSIGASPAAAANLILTNGTLKYVGLGDTTDRGFQIGNGAGTQAYLDASGTTDATHDGAIVFSNTGAIALGTTNQARTVYLTGTNTADNTLAASITNNGTSGVTNFYKDGVGKWVLSGTNTFTGTVYSYAGTLSITDSAALGTTAGSTTITNGATLDLNNVNLGAEPLFLSGMSVGVGGGSVLSATGTSSYTGTITMDNGDATFGGTGSLDYSGWLKEIYSGSIATKVGSGTLTLSGTIQPNQIEWVLNAGTVVLAKTTPSASGMTGTSVTINNGATLRIAGTTDNQLSFQTAVQLNSGGLFDLNGRNEGIPALNGTGTGIVTNTAGATTSTLTVGDMAGDFALNASSSFGGVLQDGAGTLALTKTSTGTFTVSGTNTYTGGTTIAAGTLSLGSAGALGSTGTIKMTGGILQFGAANTADYSARFSAGSNQQYRIDTNGQSVTFAGNLVSSGGTLEKIGAGTLMLSGANTYTGNTSINAGTLSVSNPTGLGTTAGYTVVSSGATLDMNAVALGAETIYLNGTGVGGIGALTATGTSSIAGDVNLNTDSSIGGAGSLTITGAVRSNMLTKIGSGTLTLAGATNNDDLNATVNAGTLILAKDAADVHAVGSLAINSGGTAQLGGTGGDQIFDFGTVTVNTGGVFDLNGRNEGFSTLGGGGVVTNTAASTTSTLTLGYLEGVTNFTGALQDGAGVLALYKAEEGQITLSGTSTYTGGTTLAAGTLSLGSAGALGSTGTITLTGGFLKFSAANTTDYSARFSTDAGQLIRIDTNGQAVTLASNLVSSGGYLQKLGAGTLNISGANTYTGGTFIDGGTLSISNTAALGTTDEDGTFVADGATLNLNNVTGVPELITLSGAGVGGNGSLTSTGTSSITGNVYVSDASTVNVSGSLSLTGSVFNGATLTKIGAGTLTLGGATDNGGLIAAVSDGKVILAKDSSADVHAVGFGLTVNNGGTAQLAGTGGDQIWTGAIVDVKTGGALDLNGRNEGIGQLTGSGTISNTAAATTSTLAVGEGDTSSTFSGTLQNGAGVLALTKTEGGTLVLTGTNTYTGDTSINGGKLVVNGSLSASSAVSINNGGTLGGHGTVGAIAINAGGLIAPGNSPGTMNTGDETWNGGGGYVWEINKADGTKGADPGYDWLNITGTLDIAATNDSDSTKFTIYITSLTLANIAGPASGFVRDQIYTLTIATASSGITNFNADKFLINTSGFFNDPGDVGQFQIVQSGNNLNLTFTAIPEPGVWGTALSVGLLAMIFAKRRRLR